MENTENKESGQAVSTVQAMGCCRIRVDLPEEEKDNPISKLVARTIQLFQVIDLCENDEDYKKICRNEIVTLNICLVTTVLKKYKPYTDDDFQTGCIGLITATNTFDVKRGVPFQNYACFCIERELHKAHKKVSHSFEYQASDLMASLDETIYLSNGDTTSKYDVIPDAASEAEINKIVGDFALDDLFNNIIEPAIEQVASATKGQKSKVDFKEWRNLERQYLLELAEIDSQKARLTLSSIAKHLGVSNQNIRMRHKRVVDYIRDLCVQRGIIY